MGRDNRKEALYACVAFAAVVLLPHVPPERCSIRALITTRPVSGMRILARALPDTVPIPTAQEDLIGGDRISAEILRNHVPVAQRFLPIEVSGSGLDIVPGSAFLVVPWAYTADCGSIPWTNSSLWVTPGEEVLFSIAPTRKLLYDQPVVDVLGWHAPYPTAEFWQHEGRGEPVGPRSQWLTAKEYYDLIAKLPTEQAAELDPRAAADSVEHLFQQSERLRSTFPGPAIREAYVISRGTRR